MVNAKWNLQNFPYHDSKRIIYMTFFTTKRALCSEGKKNEQTTNKHRNAEYISRRHKEKVAIQTESVVHKIYEGCFESNAIYLIMLAYDGRGGCWWHGHRG